jgi:nucleoid-associated protein YgaU
MFFDGSRYLKVKDATVADRTGRVVRIKRARPTPPAGGDFVYQVKAGDRLDLLAFKFYRNPRKWWLICDANPALMYPDDTLTPGQLLVIPPDQVS